jgi:hypothetical protein
MRQRTALTSPRRYPRHWDGAVHESYVTIWTDPFEDLGARPLYELRLVEVLRPDDRREGSYRHRRFATGEHPATPGPVADPSNEIAKLCTRSFPIPPM